MNLGHKIWVKNRDLIHLWYDSSREDWVVDISSKIVKNRTS
jgi:hypothetical protein